MNKLFYQFLAVLVMALGGVFSANAEAFPSDGSPIALGTVYDLQFAQSCKASFTAPSTGKLIQKGGADLEVVGANFSASLGWGEYGQMQSWDVVGGQTYEISCAFVMNSGSVVFEMEADMGVVLSSADPEAGSEISITTSIVLTFNTAVQLSSASFKVAGESYPLSAIETYTPSVVYFDISTLMKQLYGNGILNKEGGDAVEIVIEGLQSRTGILYGDDGVFSIPYVTAPKQIDLVSYTVPTRFKSYYTPGDPTSLVKFTFDGDVRPSDLLLQISCGDIEGMYYLEELTGQVEGPEVTFDLSGKLRDLNSYTIENDYVGLKLCNVYDLDGRPSVGSGSGTYASYSFTSTYQYIVPENVVCEFVPSSGSSLNNVDQIEIWFNKSSIINYDGVEFLYDYDGAQKSVIVAKPDLSISVEGDETTILVDIPAEVKGKRGITVRLYNVSSLDGYDHQIFAEYDKFVVSLISPIQPGQYIASTGEEDFVFDIFGMENYYYFRYDFYNAPGEEGWVYGSQINKADDGTWTAFNGNYPCFTDYEPRMLVTAYYNENDYWQMGGISAAAESYEFRFHGTQTPFVYSDVKFESIDPEPNSSIIPSADFCFTVKFDGLVTLDEQLTGINIGLGAGLMPFHKYEPVYEGEDFQEGYANTWLLYPGAAALADKTGIDIAIKAYDLEGKLVEGNMGADAYDYLAFSYAVYSASHYLDLEVSPDAGKVSELKMIELSYPGMPVGINYNYSGPEELSILSRDRQTVYLFSDSDIEIYSDVIGTDELGYPIYDEITTVRLHIDPAITEDGSYLLVVPQDFFTIGSQFENFANAALEVVYTIGEDTPPSGGVELSLTPEPGYVSSLERIDISAPGIENALIDYEAVVTITDEDGVVVFSATGADIDATAFDWDSWEFIGFYIEPSISADQKGVYTISIPAGMFEFDDMSTSLALTAVYNLEASDLIQSVVVETATTYNVFTLSGVKVLSTDKAADLGTLRPGFYVINGKKVLVK